MKDYLPKNIDLNNTNIIWECEDCEKTFEDNKFPGICPYCGSPFIWMKQNIKNN